MKKYGKWIVVGLIVITLSILSVILPVKEWLREFITWVQHLGPVGVVVFIVAYALATILFLPGWIFTVGAGLIYGIVGGTLVALSGAIIGATLAFLISRYLLRKNIESLTKSKPRFRAIDDAIGKNGWKIVGLLRLSPLIPFNLSNYFYGITSINFGAYVLVSAIGMIPGTLLYAYLGAIGQTGVSGGASQHNKWQYVLLGVGLVATIAVTIFVSRIAKNALKKSGAVK
ncbi:MAG: TVP38/TMEM64 family protein [Spartobacteria bacterium]